MSTTTNLTTFDLAELLWGDPAPKPRKARKPAKRVGISRDVAKMLWGNEPIKPAFPRTAAKGGAA